MTAQQLPRLLRGIPLAVRKLQRTFGSRQVLRDIDLHIPAGQFVAVVGRSGCGKSTLLRLLAGLDQPSDGQLLAGSAPLSAAQQDTRLMFQEARLLPWKKVIDNVGLGLKGNWRVQALQALDAVGLADRAAGDPRRQRSGGNRRPGDPDRRRPDRSRLAHRPATPAGSRLPSPGDPGDRSPQPRAVPARPTAAGTRTRFTLAHATALGAITPPR